MSRVTNAILTTHVGSSVAPDQEIASVNQFLRAHEVGGGEFKDVTRGAGGYKYMECRVYLSAFNHADTHLIEKAVQQAPWLDKEMVQLFVKEQEEELFTVRYSGSEANRARVRLAPNELRILSNALNEVCNGIEIQSEFETRVGCSIEIARDLLTRLANALPAL
jgi:Tfp pilus assembly protein PilW